MAPALLEAIQRITDDPAFGNVDFEQIDPEQFLTRISFYGDDEQRAALAVCVTPAVGASLPGIWQIAKGNSKSSELVAQFLSANIQALCNFFGVDFRGDIHAFTRVILREYGGLSALDFLIFFDRAKAGRYKTEYQSISTRGITVEFLQEWLNAYSEERAHDLEQLYAGGEYRGGEGNAGKPADPSFIVGLSQKMQEAKNKRNALLSLATEARKKWEANAATETKFRQMILDYVLFCKRVGIEDLMSEFMDSGKKKYGEKWRQFRFAEMKTVMIEVRRLKGKMPVDVLLSTIIADQFPNMDAASIGAGIGKITASFRETYFSEYLPECIESGYPPLSEPDYIWQCGLFQYRKHTGENPAYKIIFE